MSTAGVRCFGIAPGPTTFAGINTYGSELTPVSFGLCFLTYELIPSPSANVCNTSSSASAALISPSRSICSICLRNNSAWSSNSCLLFRAAARSRSAAFLASACTRAASIDALDPFDLVLRRLLVFDALSDGCISSSLSRFTVMPSRSCFNLSLSLILWENSLTFSSFALNQISCFSRSSTGNNSSRALCAFFASKINSPYLLKLPSKSESSPDSINVLMVSFKLAALFR